MKLFLYSILTLTLVSLFLPWESGRTGFQMMIPTADVDWQYVYEARTGIYRTIATMIILSSLIYSIYYIDSKKLAARNGMIISLSVLIYILYSAFCHRIFLIIPLCSLGFGSSLFYGGKLYAIFMFYILFLTFLYIKRSGTWGNKPTPPPDRLRVVLILFNMIFVLSIAAYAYISKPENPFIPKDVQFEETSSFEVKESIPF